MPRKAATAGAHVVLTVRARDGADPEVVFANAPARELLELTVPCPLPAPDGPVHPDDQRALREAIAACPSRGDAYDVVLRIGRPGVDWSTLDCVVARTSDDELTVVGQDRAGLGEVDIVTGLGSRSQLLDRLGRRLASTRSDRRAGSAFAFLVVDVDRFGELNDALGQRAGDELLGTVAQRLEGCVRPDDSVARVAADEFNVLVDRITSSADVRAICRRIQADVAHPLSLAGTDLFVTVTIGVALSDSNFQSPADMLRAANTALHRAKEYGPGGTVVFDAGMGADVLERLKLETDLRSAVERGQLSLQYQPVIDLVQGRVVGFEALARWDRPGYGRIPPAVFIPIAEDTGLIHAIGHWVTREAVRVAARWTGAYADAFVSVNLSPVQMGSAELAIEVRRALVDADLPPNRLKLEVTETALMVNPPAAARTLEAIREIGVGLALDDFGTGHSSLAYLDRFRFDTLKIDRSFVAKLGKADRRQTGIVPTVVALAGSMGMEVVAEGVETTEQLELLRDFGCELGQGFLFARPLPAEELELLHPAARWSVQFGD